ncbi:ATP-dependent acyl-CoA ligase [Pseudomaricurvus alkylphenolicus]|uniref:AMP-binding protein n=1 Tax=Pseudomaricurvus alkylphenolicus TaxID=1306991 RepID=UPI0014226BF3|nr:ATP-dependent acyl-CoA ligase [Pseudomaricurvus alkylphenolicus]
MAGGEIGELCIREKEKHFIFNGYFDEPEATQESFKKGWFVTGDLLKRDAVDGACYFIDRKKDSVRFGGRNIASAEVESVVRKHPAVADVAAIGIPTEVMES